MPGRKPTPKAVKELHGNPGHRPINQTEPQFSGRPQCPAFLPAAARVEWDRIAVQLQELDMLKSTDQAALAAYCMAFARWQSAEEIINAEGQTTSEPVLSRSGEVLGAKVKRHPATIIARDERASMLKAASLFGFDPSSRSRVHMPEVKEPAPDDSFLDNLYADSPNTGRIVH